jgi:hypothetical protein
LGSSPGLSIGHIHSSTLEFSTSLVYNLIIKLLVEDIFNFLLHSIAFWLIDKTIWLLVVSGFLQFHLFSAFGLHSSDCAVLFGSCFGFYLAINITSFFDLAILKLINGNLDASISFVLAQKNCPDLDWKHPLEDD